MSRVERKRAVSRESSSSRKIIAYTNKDIKYNKVMVDGRSKVLRYKKLKGEPANPDTLLAVINLFRERFCQKVLEKETYLSKYIQDLVAKQDIRVRFNDERVSFSCCSIVDDFNGQTAPALVKSWTRSSNKLNSLLAPANYGYCDTVTLDDGSKKMVFVSVLAFE